MELGPVKKNLFSSDVEFMFEGVIMIANLNRVLCL